MEAGPRAIRSHQLRDDLRKELFDRAFKQTVGDSGPIAPLGCLEEVWTPERLEEFGFLELPRLSRHDIEGLRANFIQTISILIWIRWDKWTRFEELFFRHQDDSGRLDRTDSDIPCYRRETLKSDNFLGDGYAWEFIEARKIFCPVDIIEDQKVEQSGEWRLPFIAELSENRGEGRSGTVTKELIHAKHFISRNVRSSTETEIARKRFTSKPDFLREIANLKKLRESDAQNTRLVLHIATVVIGNEFSILFPLATMDLEGFLRGSHIPHHQCDVIELVEEAAALAAALDHLHTRLGLGIKGCHMDLKPDNILVFFDPTDPGCRSIGKWKITDFGLSIIERRITEDISPKAVTETIARLEKKRGVYHAPEILIDGKASQRTDIWSFGCILVQIFAFRLDGILGLEDLHLLGGGNNHQFEDPLHNDYFTQGHPPALSRHIEGWLRGLPDNRIDYTTPFLKACSDLLLWMLKTARSHRPTAKQVHDSLARFKGAYYATHPRGSMDTPGSLDTSNPVYETDPVDGTDPVDETESVERPERNDSPSDIPPPAEPDVPSSYRRPSQFSRSSRTRSDVIRSLVNAIGNHDLAAIEIFLHNIDDIEQEFDHDRPLIYAVEYENTAAVEELLSGYPTIDLEKPGSKGYTPLGLAVYKNHEEMVQILLQHGAGVNTTSNGGLTPLMIAAREGHVEIFEQLLNPDATAEAANRELRSNEGLTCLHYAAWKVNGAKFVELYHSSLHSVDIKSQETSPETPLITLIKSFKNTDHWEKMFLEFVKRRANLSPPDCKTTPLAIAVEENYDRAAELLLQCGAELEDFSGFEISPSMRGIFKREKAKREGGSNFPGPIRRRSSLLSGLFSPKSR